MSRKPQEDTRTRAERLQAILRLIASTPSAARKSCRTT